MIRVDQAFENIRYTENELKKRGYKPLYIGLYGSDNYHLNTAESDYDFKAIVAPTIRDFIKGKQVSTTIELPFGLCDVKNPQNMFNCWKKQNINFLEILFTNYYLFNDNLFYDLREMREEIARWRPLNNVMCIYGMACEKYHALFHKYPSNKEKIEKYGYDSKQLHHLLRLQYFICDYFEFLMGRRTYKEILIPSYEDREYLISIKTYERTYSIDEVKLLADEAMKRIKNMKDIIINKSVLDLSENKQTTEKMDSILEELVTNSLKEELKNA